MGLGSSVALSCGVVCRYSLDPTLLWVWQRPAGTVPIQPLAWELPYAMGEALKRKKKKYMKRNQTKILEMEVTIAEMKIEIFNSRSEEAEKRTNEFGDKAIQIIYTV